MLNDDADYLISYNYSDFGETTRIGDSAVFNEIAYTGGVYDDSTKLYYLNARYYDPDDGTFLTQDTYRGENADPSSLHLYAYCAGDPINFIDPSGHKYKWAYGNNSAEYFTGVPDYGWIGYEIDAYVSIKYKKAKSKKKTILNMSFSAYGVKQTVNKNNGTGRLVHVKIMKGKKCWKKIKGTKKVVKGGSPVIFGSNRCLFTNKQIKKNYKVGKKSVSVKA